MGPGKAGRLKYSGLMSLKELSYLPGHKKKFIKIRNQKEGMDSNQWLSE